VCKAAGLTAIYVTHDQAEALSTADRIALLVNGRVAQVGTPRELYERPASRPVAQFIGEANLISAIATDGAARTAFGTLRAGPLPAGTADGAHLTLCIRPERLRLAAPGETENVFEATIDEGHYLGASAQWKVVAGNGTPLLVAEAMPPARAAGERLRLRVAPEDVVVLPG
jgi:ABC-type Fe3+/spermidine/putrescine transport system ATPase subunit